VIALSELRLWPALPILAGKKSDMALGDLKENENGKWVFLTNDAGTESPEFETKGEAEDAAKVEMEADFQRRLRNFNAMKSSQQIG
jgi:hypothetical protein